VVLPLSRVLSAEAGEQREIGPEYQLDSGLEDDRRTGFEGAQGCPLTIAVRRRGAGRAPNPLAQKPIAMAISERQRPTAPPA
jgi:hypothetical protein